MTDTTSDLIQQLTDALTNAIRVIHNEDGTQHISTAAPVLTEAHAFLDQPEPPGLPPDYIGSEHTGCDREMLEVFYRACRSEGGSADEIYLRGLKAVIAMAQPEPEGLTDEGILQIAAATIEPYESCGIAIGEYEPENECAVEAYGSELIAFARAVLARWGRKLSS